jgi:hypothetical protein
MLDILKLYSSYLKNVEANAVFIELRQRLDRALRLCLNLCRMLLLQLLVAMLYPSIINVVLGM